jgi:ParB family chromosome partitioning protein
MAKKINILSAGSNIPFADAGLKLSKQIKISEIEEHPDFKTLFVIDEEDLQRIKDSMTKNGFDNSQPVHIWHVIDENGTEHFYLIDGYTRLAALKELGMETVPYYEHKFADFEEAFSYVLGLQVNRRNLSGP